MVAIDHSPLPFRYGRAYQGALRLRTTSTMTESIMTSKPKAFAASTAARAAASPPSPPSQAPSQGPLMKMNLKAAKGRPRRFVITPGGVAVLAIALVAVVAAFFLPGAAAASSEEILAKMSQLAGPFSNKIAAILQRWTGVPIGGSCGFGRPYYVCWKQMVAAGVPKGGPCEIGTAKGICSPLCSKHVCEV